MVRTHQGSDRCPVNTTDAVWVTPRPATSSPRRWMTGRKPLPWGLSPTAHLPAHAVGTPRPAALFAPFFRARAGRSRPTRGHDSVIKRLPSIKSKQIRPPRTRRADSPAKQKRVRQNMWSTPLRPTPLTGHHRSDFFSRRNPSRQEIRRARPTGAILNGNQWFAAAHRKGRQTNKATTPDSGPTRRRHPRRTPPARPSHRQLTPCQFPCDAGRLGARDTRSRRVPHRTDHSGT
jgi:hypothetical protein